jgi:hypothetical protein
MDIVERGQGFEDSRLRVNNNKKNTRPLESWNPRILLLIPGILKSFLINERGDMNGTI